MKSASLTRDAILDEAQEGALLLTVNKRLARQLRQAFDQRMNQKGYLAWRTPQILSLNVWLRQILASLDDDSQFLGRFAALHLWEKVIEEDATATKNDLLHFSKTALQAAEAHQLLQDYGLEIETSHLTADQEAFCRWRQAYQQRCREGDWVDAAGLLGIALREIGQRRVSVPASTLFIGFDDIPPQLAVLAGELVARYGCEARFVTVEGSPGCPTLLACQDRPAEVRAAAIWARDLLAAGETNIGIVVPELPRYQSLIKRIFPAEIDPRARLNPALEEESFTLSLGERASDMGLVFAALKILEPGLRLSMDEASFLLRTPYLKGSQQEVTTRSRCEQGLRFLRKKTFSLSRLEDVSRKQPFSCPQMGDVWKSLREFRSGHRRQLPGAWASTFSRLLADLGWPGERALNSQDYQLYKAWQEKILPQLASLDGISPPVTHGTALSLLRRIASETVFQPEGPQSPLQIMGLLESAGLQFNHLWVMGLDEDTLPARARPNPFLPAFWQATHQMPHSSGERELEYANRVCFRLFRSAPNIMLSYPQWEGDCLLRPSPLVATIPVGAPPFNQSHDPIRLLNASRAELDSLVDQTGPPVSAEENVGGGTNVLRDQALCPFRGFAGHRLRVKVPQASVLGIDSGTRGNLLHAVLESFWSITGDSAGLVALSDEELALRVEACIQDVAPQFFMTNDPDIPHFVQDLEKERLKELVSFWLQHVEKKRSSFAVQAVESRQLVSVGPLSLEVRADRIDRLPDDSLVVIDYKTGQPDLKGLLDRPLLEPQLAIYGLNPVTGSDSLAGVAFAVIRSDECGFKGITKEEDVLPRVDSVDQSKILMRQGIEQWNQLTHRWLEDLEDIARAFASGEAAVRPVDESRACRYCDLHPLCRVFEQDQAGEECD